MLDVKEGPYKAICEVLLWLLHKKYRVTHVKICNYQSTDSNLRSNTRRTCSSYLFLWPTEFPVLSYFQILRPLSEILSHLFCLKDVVPRDGIFDRQKINLGWKYLGAVCKPENEMINVIFYDPYLP